MATDITLPAWVDRIAFPFTPRTFHHPDGRMHHVDEGHGPVILFVHGTPDWSFGFRHLIAALRSTHRCIAPDHLGFGLSDKPVQADFTVAAHARRLQDLIDHLGLKDLTLVVTDFGGGIGLQHALEHPENVKRIVLYNTWLWDLMPDRRFSRPSAIMHTGFGRLLYLRFGFSVNVMMPSGYGDKRKLTKAVHAHFKNALPDPASRKATFACVREIANAGPFWQAQWSKVDRLRAIPTLLCWGMRDRFFPPDLLERWRSALPHAEVVAFHDAGHFLHEEAHVLLIAAMTASTSPPCR
ncbi:MAG TPA: alpha/beta fold hydrolase [Flavobacteriales bacterium]|nr:alpha/beta fold hydrolase [Flavobacteriales bacterium]HMR27436.1 alpha/beta fold hydrolase [Flavobacteriales bacterium]